ncbi:DNA translocase FtsK [Rhizobium hidalgonense]|uniref:DNA translocase FtsK n=1 Tax=Rhizobium hidalgonense TaxID=1538159 RepID=A0A2A6KCB3_9HYPH|nr:DNA translocase FtsK [Rhizobium hidalgonense]EJC74769.1 DNA segregation ATPase, FtsK/SpoIIIE family [Rhizobium leguminosarum bv. trifolii WSM2012]MDR9775753.1 DNA translocase FtsK [Rhizobium hidalgonense]MDR9813714.1 DNA translocase FtsK [Rhizobium hidalgonense]MDR9822150.1 DNA translocase FtsK [Rhizobium hidalgonense]PDT22141.1 DNA translocase FtsK [Rhizobium hidalgonense]
MRFPRTNLTDAGDFSSGIETDLPEVHPGEKPAAPIWQSNFSLAPNVRFTRTPETLISKRRAPDEPARDDSQIGQQAIRIEPVAVDVPFDIYLPEPDELAAAQQIELQPSLVPDEPAFRATAELASISDFAFWEVMAFEEAVPVRAPALISFPKAEIAPESITSLFRIMEWRPGRPAAAPVASRPVSPAATISAKPAVRPPAAISLERPRRIAVQAAVAPAPQAAPAPQIAPAPHVAPAPAASVTQAAPEPQRTPPVAAVLPSPRRVAKPERIDASGYEFPPRALLQEPPERLGEIMSQETLEQNAGLLESVLEDFGIKGEIIHVRPGPVVTLYEFEPAPGVKSSRVIGLADDIARSMSALSARVAVVPGRNVIGIELPNVTRETVYFREMIESQDFEKSGYKLALGLGKTIGGEPVIAELAKMPHLLVAGTTGSGKSVAINTMILSLLYRMTPEQCRLIMVDPKMLELSVYDGIPHLLTPVVTDPKKAVMALKWAVREMEERYRKMSRLGVRNIDGYNGRVSEAREKGETIHIMVQVGFDRQTGAPIEESQELDLAPMPYIVVIVDEMADLMMVAGKEIEGAIQRLAQMARAAGIHLIMATQRPSVDVITGTIKANFPTRISFQVTSKIDSRTILGEQGAEQLLGQGDMLHMQGGGRISRVHGPFVSDAEVEKVVAHLKTQGRPEYLDTVTADEEEETEEEEAGAVFDKSAMASEDGNELYEQAVKVVMRDKKCSTSYIQRRLGIGYNRAASLVERMEKEGLVGPANHVGKREIVSGRGDGD